jgi:hypothetical protein
MGTAASGGAEFGGEGGAPNERGGQGGAESAGSGTDDFDRIPHEEFGSTPPEDYLVAVVGDGLTVHAPHADDLRDVTGSSTRVSEFFDQVASATFEPAGKKFREPIFVTIELSLPPGEIDRYTFWVEHVSETGSEWFLPYVLDSPARLGFWTTHFSTFNVYFNGTLPTASELPTPLPPGGAEPPVFESPDDITPGGGLTPPIEVPVQMALTELLLRASVINQMVRKRCGSEGMESSLDADATEMLERVGQDLLDALLKEPPEERALILESGNEVSRSGERHLAYSSYGHELSDAGARSSFPLAETMQVRALDDESAMRMTVELASGLGSPGLDALQSAVDGFQQLASGIEGILNVAFGNEESAAEYVREFIRHVVTLREAWADLADAAEQASGTDVLTELAARSVRLVWKTESAVLVPSVVADPSEQLVRRVVSGTKRQITEFTLKDGALLGGGTLGGRIEELELSAEYELEVRGGPVLCDGDISGTTTTSMEASVPITFEPLPFSVHSMRVADDRGGSGIAGQRFVLEAGALLVVRGVSPGWQVTADAESTVECSEAPAGVLTCAIECSGPDTIHVSDLEFQFAGYRAAIGVCELLRFDGLYVAPQNDYSGYLRFYPDGWVSAASSTGTASQVAEWLGRDHANSSQGTYTLDGDAIAFVTTSSAGSVEYSGTVLPDSMTLDVHSLINDARNTRTYSFTAVAFPPEP